MVGFERVELAGGASATAEIQASPQEIACVDDEGKVMLNAGMVRVEVGDISEPATAKTTVIGAAVQLPECSI